MRFANSYYHSSFSVVVPCFAIIIIINLQLIHFSFCLQLIISIYLIFNALFFERFLSIIGFFRARDEGSERHVRNFHEILTNNNITFAFSIC